MKLPCAIVRDLLPLYAEKLTEDETTKMVAEHLTSCKNCRQRLTEIDTSFISPAESPEPLRALKKELQNRRRFTAAITALMVFVFLFPIFYHAASMKLVPWQDGLIEVLGVKPLQSADKTYTDENSSSIAMPPSSQITDSFSHESSEHALILNVDSSLNGFETQWITAEDGTKIMILQAFSTHPDVHITSSYYELTLSPVPDRLIYGVHESQKLLWGAPLSGGVMVLPRLALSYYLLIAAAGAAVICIPWLIFRKHNSHWVFRQLFLVPASYVISHFLLKGREMTSFFLSRDILCIMLLAIALYALFTLAILGIACRKRER